MKPIFCDLPLPLVLLGWGSNPGKPWAHWAPHPVPLKTYHFLFSIEAGRSGYHRDQSPGPWGRQSGLVLGLLKVPWELGL